MHDAQQFCPSPADLDLLELMRIGAYRPTRNFPAKIGAPQDLVPGTVELVDPEGVPLAIAPVEMVDGDLMVAIRTTPKWLGGLSARPFERLFRRPAEITAAVRAGADVLLVDRPVSEADIDALADGTSVILMVLAGPSSAPTSRTLGLLRSVCRLESARPEVQALAVPIDPMCSTAAPDLYSAVLQAYAPNGYLRLDQPDVAASTSEGLVIFFTGLSGSGKSTVARAVRNTILERSGRPVTLLDGDIVRRTLSAGLGFSPEERETNVRRIGWVAAQIAHHGGIAICSPIAPYALTREWVRTTVNENGGQFVLIHVSTPLEVCEERDRKGLYAKARDGIIQEFTGLSAPYEEPTDADLVLDTAAMTIDQARGRVEHLLTSRGILKLPSH